MGWGRFIARRRRAGLLRWLDRMARKYRRAYANNDYDPRTNGEQRVLQVLGRHLQGGVILDVGANVGHWSLLAAQHCPGTTIHALELVPDTHAQLVLACAGVPAIRPHALGLSDRVGTLTMHLIAGRSVLATSVAGFAESEHKQPTTPVDAHVSDGDSFCARHGIERIELLKLDVEGHEPQVFRGLAGLLGRGAVRALQFEYGTINIDTHFLLRDAYQLLEGHGMVVGKIYPSYVDFRPYKRRDEDFLGPNYLAVHASDTALRADLAGS